ncbi:MAG TPA: diacylglycerol kinase family protein [Ramlibacter sp.]|uniref:diacylglycerol/lipid kinase family protein n=1 Tax=Ramlibacter sp. TaxID=1917967 RepID=UPI002D8080E5|nr:diacylglycerol kinase family protein [Ramlibacter sp.]HET8747994.1 diacylglycerol kinase family protein [Ramlibacter sp.]
MAAVLPASDSADQDGVAAARAQPEFFIVMNRGSGSHEGEDVRAAVVTELERAGRAHRFVPVPPGEIVQACQDAARMAREHGGVLVAVGGDGTLNCAAQAALAHDCPLGVVAQGTFNLFAREHGLPLEAAEAVRALLAARPEPVQVGWVNQRVFLVNASVGLYPKLLADREVVKQRLGRRRWIAMLAALKSLLEWRLQLVLDAELDGQLTKLRTASVFVCNNRLQLERVGVEEAVVAQVGEGRLAGLLVRGTSPWTKLRMLFKAACGRLAAEPEIHSFTLRTLAVGARGARRLKVATDGEVTWMQLPLRFTVAPRPLQVMLPPPELRLPVR